MGFTKSHDNIKQIIKNCWIYLGILFVIMAVVFAVFRALTPWATQYKDNVEQYLTTLLKEHVSIKSMETSWYWFRPVLRLNQVSLTDNQAKTVHIRKLLVGINLLDSIVHRQIRPGVLYLEKTQVNVHQTDTDWSIDGLVINGKKVDIAENSYIPLVAWLSTWDRLVIRHATVNIFLKDKSKIPIQHINLSIQNKGGHYYVRGRAAIYDKSPTQVSVKADIQLNTQNIQHSKGHVSLSIDSFYPEQLQKYLTSLPITMSKGHGSLKFWMDFKNGMFTQVQTVFHLKHFALQQTGQKNAQWIESLGGNFGWRKSKEGWELNGNRVMLQMNGIHWPENMFFVRYNTTQQSHHIYMQHILLTALQSVQLKWPPILQPVINLKPRGQLKDVELVLSKMQPTYLLVGFSNLSWIYHDNIPGVTNLSGVLLWQPQEGRLQLDSYDVGISPRQIPSATFSKVNVHASWDTKEQKTQLNLENFYLKGAGLDLSAVGVIHSLNDAPKIQLEGKFSAEQAQQWFKYIPPKSLKPKLIEWLQQDIKSIGQLNGNFNVHGLWNDFPFDSTPGAFNIQAIINNMDLYFKSKWPLTKNVNAYLTVDKRNLAAEIHHADLNGVPVNKVNLRIDNIGFDFETLLIHGELHANANHVLSYLVHSPLKDILGKLNALSIEGMLGLDLKLEIPLYPQNDDVLTRGIVLLNNNKVVLHHPKTDISFGQVSGLINFNEKGLTKSNLTAVAPDTTLKLTLDSANNGNPMTQINFTGNTTVEGMQYMLHLPLTNYMRGPLDLTGVVVLNGGSKKTDTIRINSDLKDVQVDLPGPLAKLPGTIAPVTLSLDVNGEKIQKIKVNYKEAPLPIQVEAYPLDSDEWAFDISHKYLSAKVRYHNATGTLLGNIKRLQLPQLVNGSTSFMNNRKNLTPQDIPNLDLTIESLLYNDMDLGQLTIESISTKSSWELTSCKLMTPSYTLAMKGNWIYTERYSQTELDGEFKTSDLAKSLQRWKIQSLVEANKGQINFSINWPANVFDFSLAKLDGELNAQLQDGRIPDLSRATEEKLGLGKLLSILSLQTIPRRLKLDFSDLYKSGYNFDQFKGNFKINHGVMTTENSSVDGPVAFVGMKGNVDLGKQRLDMNLHVAPHVMASLPVVATIAGGPILGIATWVASKIINEGFYRVTGYTYQVTGPWHDPTVQQKSILKHFYPPSQLPRTQ